MNAALAGWFLASIACDVAGQLCFKRGAGARRSPQNTGTIGLLAPVVHPWVLSGAGVYALEIVVWLRILSLVPLSIAFPIASLNFLAITVASRWWLGEPVSARRWAGAVLVTIGVALVAQGV